MPWGILLRPRRDRPVDPQPPPEAGRVIRDLRDVAVVQAERGSNLLLVVAIVLGAIACAVAVAAAISEFP